MTHMTVGFILQNAIFATKATRLCSNDTPSNNPTLGANVANSVTDGRMDCKIMLLLHTLTIWGGDGMTDGKILLL